MALLDRQAWLFSIKAYLASIAALYVGLACNLSRPYWAMATVYVVAQPLLGPTHAKGIYRIVGTLIAGVATLIMVPNLVETPLLLSAVMSLWLSGCLFLALLNRGPRNYAFMLAGYTAAFIGFPAVTAPEGIFDTVVARSEEIVLGALMAVLFSALVLPASVRPMLNGRIGGWMRDAAQWCRQALARGRGHGPRNRLAADLVQFEALIDFLRHDDPRLAGADVPMQRLRERMLLLLPVLSSISDRLGALGAHGRALPAGLEALVADIAEWLASEQPPSAGQYAALRARIAALKPTVDSDIEHLLLATLLLRLEELVDLWQDCLGLRATIVHGSPAPELHYRIRTPRASREARHVDYGMVTFSALSAGIALMAYCTLWIAIGWEGGGNGAMMAAVAAAFFAAQDDPAPSMMSFLVWAMVASVIAFVLLFGIFPAIHDFVPLALVLGVVFLPLGVLIHRPKTMMIGLPLTVNLVALLNLSNSYSANFQSFANSSIAMFIGMGFAVVLTRVTRSVGAEWTARRLVRQGWTTLAEAAEGRGQQDRRQFAARMLDLLGLLAPRLANTPEGSDIASVDMLGEARVGLNILQLRRARLELPESSMQAVDTILGEVAAHYRRQVAQRRPLAGPAELRSLLDASLARVGKVAPGKARDEALMGLVGLRYSLFPDESPRPGEAALQVQPA
jgi:uncharacterized membrane protein YccC